MKILNLLFLINLFTSFTLKVHSLERTVEYYQEYFSPFFTIASSDVETGLTFQTSTKTISISIWNLNNITELQRAKYTKNYLSDLKITINKEYRKNMGKFKKNFNRSILPISKYVKSLWLQCTWFNNIKTGPQFVQLTSKFVSEFIKDKNLIYKLHFVDPKYTLILFNAIGKCGTSATTFELWDLIS